MKKKVIMLVEDNADDEKLTIRALKKHNIMNDIIIARDGAEAIDYLLGKEKHPLPQIILLDLKLPKIDGIEVLRQIRVNKRTQCIPVVILTLSKEEQDLINGYRSGANSYIRKPVDFEQFAAAIKDLGMYWLVLNEPPPIGD